MNQQKWAEINQEGNETLIYAIATDKKVTKQKKNKN